MKIVLIALATMPLAFSACKTSPAEGRKMTEPAMRAPTSGETQGPGMAMAQPGGAEPAMANGATMAAPGAAMAPAMAPAMAGGAAPSRTMGAKSKPSMKMADDKKGQVAGTRL